MKKIIKLIVNEDNDKKRIDSFIAFCEKRISRTKIKDLIENGFLKIMFNQLQDRLSNVIKTLKGQGKISEKNVQDAIRDVRRALLEADVNLMVVRSFIDLVQAKSIGDKVLNSITPDQQFIKIIHDEMIDFLSSEDTEINYRQSLGYRNP